MNVPSERAGAILTVDLDGIAANYHILRNRLGRTECAAVVKADAYGLGAIPVSFALYRAGCRKFFVAHLEEALLLRKTLHEDAEIFVLNGIPPRTEAEFSNAGVVPVLNTLGELEAWQAHACEIGIRLPAALQVDSGMSRLGLPPADVERIADDRDGLAGVDLHLAMSHLACADEPDHPANEAQRRAFDRMRSILPSAPASLANSSGIFLGPAFHYDLGRPGAALYGVNPTPFVPNPMRPVVRLAARLLQLRDVSAGTGIGYGQTARAAADMRLATLAFGYADGWPRNAAGAAFLNGTRLPFAGRVSMDSIIVEVSPTAAGGLTEGMFVDLICDRQDVDAVAELAGTIGYEILTRLGGRMHRRYVGGEARGAGIADDPDRR